jgi:hypothetical protein
VQQAGEPVPDRVPAGTESGAPAEPDTRSRAGDESSTGLGGLTAAAGLPQRTPERDPLPGMVVGGVKIVRLLAEGGMGRVYEGIQEQPSRPVAVKVLRPVFVTAEARRRFRQEVEILGTLDHPGIARILSAGSCEVLGTSLPYLVMELVPGARTLVAHAEAAGLDVDGRIALMIDVCDAVAAGHARGIVHRDLKPGNVLVDGAGRPRVIDFGVARWSDSSDADGGLTMTGQFIGTLRYTSPEQLPSARGTVDARSDVYSLGVMLHELLAGRPLHAGSGHGPAEPERSLAVRSAPRLRRLNPAVPAAIERVVTRCLARNPADRFPDAAALAAALRDGLAPASRRSVSRRLAVAGVLGGAVAVPLALVAARRRTVGPGHMAFQFDLREPPGPVLLRADRARIYAEPFGDVIYWAPTAPGEWAEVVYRLESPFPVAGASFAGVDIYAANMHNIVTFDELAEARVDVSRDGGRWTPLAASSPTAPRLRNDTGAAAAILGATTVFLRAKLYESKSFNQNRVHYAQFLRSEPALVRIPVLTVFRDRSAVGTDRRA